MGSREEALALCPSSESASACVKGDGDGPLQAVIGLNELRHLKC
jgi:hypothetical protein